MAPWERIFAHVDMDAFYASVEIRDDPSLAGRPVVVGGSPGARGVVSAASYEARRFGIHSAMPMAEAVRRCPRLVILPGDFAKYRSVSEQLMEIFGRYSPAVEPLSLDEAFLDLSGTRRSLGPADLLGRRIKEDIRSATRLTASVGIAPVKFVAKIASDLEKPDGLVLVAPGEVEAFLRPLPIGRLWGVGPRTREALEAIGIRTIGRLAAADRKLLVGRFGRHGEHLHDLALGRDAREVVPDWEARSYSHEETFARDRADAEFLEGVLLDQAHRVSRRLRRDAVCGRTVQLKLRFSDFRTITRRETLSRPTADASVIYRTGRDLFARHWAHGAVRLIGIGVSGIVPAAAGSLDLFTDREAEERRQRLAEAIDRLDERFGRSTLLPAKVLRAREGDGPHPRRPPRGA
ncbi:MAG: DNA polymerase IV [Candidatus Eisenbacteria bacterium]|uniref:DNA polymerase IV n=1 Tax=Eiseniibacteriota bacterium TaxID=2212470 RepID=A0A938BN90_UNCEI|nr:DNA polymerase IV [Candidatus Eisenbacteria bacterium]